MSTKQLQRQRIIENGDPTSSSEDDIRSDDDDEDTRNIKDLIIETKKTTARDISNRNIQKYKKISENLKSSSLIRKLCIFKWKSGATKGERCNAERVKGKKYCVIHRSTVSSRKWREKKRARKSEPQALSGKNNTPAGPAKMKDEFEELLRISSVTTEGTIAELKKNPTLSLSEMKEQIDKMLEVEPPKDELPKMSQEIEEELHAHCRSILGKFGDGSSDHISKHWDEMLATIKPEECPANFFLWVEKNEISISDEKKLITRSLEYELGEILIKERTANQMAVD
jgi:hypothetical protein